MSVKLHKTQSYQKFMKEFDELRGLAVDQLAHKLGVPLELASVIMGYLWRTDPHEPVIQNAAKEYCKRVDGMYAHCRKEQP